MDLNLILFATIIGITGGLLGIFYRNCLKPNNMIFSWWFDILKRWVKEERCHFKTEMCGDKLNVSMIFSKPSIWKRFLAWIAYPLGYCVYCTSTWITIILYLVTSGVNIWILTSMGIQHLVVMICCRFLINEFEDLKYKR